MSKYNRIEAQSFLDKLYNENKIKIKAISKTSCGRAYWGTREIKVPIPTNEDRFGVCLHEVKHIIDGNKGKRYEQEFRCDVYALDGLKKFGYETTGWKKRMRWHVLSRVAMATNRGLKIVSKDIKEFYPDVDFNKWIGKRVFVSWDNKKGEVDNISVEKK
jgi:hypothetical protein